MNPRFALGLAVLLQQVKPEVDGVFLQAVAGSGCLPATRRWFDFL